MRVPRPRTVVLRARTLSQMPVRFAAAGALAWILQHQLDHLDGILPTERRFGRRCRTLSFASPPPAWAEPHAGNVALDAEVVCLQHEPIARRATFKPE